MTSPLAFAREFISRGTPMTPAELATVPAMLLDAALNDPYYSPRTRDDDRQIDSKLTELFGIPWRVWLHPVLVGTDTLGARLSEFSREEVAVLARRVFRDWQHLTRLHTQMSSDPRENPEAIADVAKRRDHAEAYHKALVAALEDRERGTLDTWCLDEALLG